METEDSQRVLPGPGETGLGALRLACRVLPGRDLDAVSLRAGLLGASLAAPVVVTGDQPGLARAATEHGVGLVGNRLGPDRPPLWLARLDVTELLDGPEPAERLVSTLEADGLVVRLNGLEAALRPDGRPRMGGAAEAVAAAVERLAPLPVLGCGAGLGLDPADARDLGAAGVAALGIGGCRGAWGVPTVDSLAEAALVVPGLPVVAAADDGVEAAKCLALGAAAVSAAGHDLAGLLHELRVAVWTTGVAGVGDLTPGHLRCA